MGNEAILITQLRAFKKKASKLIKIEHLILFGSRTAGKTHKWSDIDLLIVSKQFDKKRPMDRGLNLYDAWSLHHPVDFICYSVEEFDKAKKMRGLVAEAIRTGTVI